ncbi:hypothetical protein SLE2022_218160 [Rubroshorea leprosula]
MLFGLLPNPKLETSVLSVCLATTSTLYPILEGLGATTRISNVLGARNAQAARRSIITVLLMVISESVLVSATLFANWHVFGYVMSLAMRRKLSIMSQTWPLYYVYQFY